MAVPIFAEGKFHSPYNTITNTQTCRNMNESTDKEQQQQQRPNKNWTISSVLIVFGCWQYSLLCILFTRIFHAMRCNQIALCAILPIFCWNNRKNQKSTHREAYKIRSANRTQLHAYAHFQALYVPYRDQISIKHRAKRHGKRLMTHFYHFSIHSQWIFVRKN